MNYYVSSINYHLINMNTIGKEYLETVIRRVKYYKDLVEKAFEQLDEKDRSRIGHASRGGRGAVV